MNAGVTSERVYEALKARLLAGAILPGERLEPKRLASLLASSVTPVRDALHRLAGEHLVEMRAAEGFQLPLVTEPGLRDLIHWNGELLRFALRRWVAAPPAPPEAVPAEGYAERVRRLFGLVAAHSGSAEFRRQIEAASDRLAAARTAEERAALGRADELAEIASAIASGDPNATARHVGAYHRRKLLLVPAIVEAMYRTADPAAE